MRDGALVCPKPSQRASYPSRYRESALRNRNPALTGLSRQMRPRDSRQMVAVRVSAEEIGPWPGRYC
jgi:hypothetical protein